MKRVNWLVGATLVACSGLVVSSALAQPAAEKKHDKPAATAKVADPKAGDKAKMPEGMPSAEEMAKMMEAGQPGPMHERLTNTAGTWEGKVKMWMAPGTPASESTCVTKIQSLFGGRFTHLETKGNMDMGGGQTMPFEGGGIYGYNNLSKKFESTWFDSMGTMQMWSTGTLEADGKTIDWVSSPYICPMTGKNVTSRMVEKITGADAMTLEMYGPNPADGKEYKMMEITYKRTAKGDAHHDEKGEMHEKGEKAKDKK